MKDYFESDYLKKLYNKNLYNCKTVGYDNINSRIFQKNLNQNINIINKKVLNNSYNFTPYREVLILKGKKKYPRIISIPTIRDKVVHLAISNYLKDNYNNKINMEIPHTIIKKIIDTLKQESYCFSMDISKFYDSINHDLLYEKLKDDRIDNNIIKLIKDAIETPTVSEFENRNVKNDEGVPQGLSISNLLASIFMKDFDSSFQDICVCRYVDDIFMISNNKANRDLYYNKIKKYLGNKLNLKINETKSKKYKKEEDFYYLGYVFKKNRVTVRSKSKIKLEKSIENIFKEYFYKIKNEKNQEERDRLIKIFAFKLNLRITGCISEEGDRYGWLFYFSKINDLELLYHLDWFIKKMFKRFRLEELYENIKLKKFVKSFYKIKNMSKNKGYIVDFSKYETVHKKKLIGLFNVKFKNRKEVNSKTIDIEFKRIVCNLYKDLERDIDKFS